MQGLEADLIIQADQVKPGTSALEQYGATVIKTSLSDEDAAKLQEALTPATA